jgi:hypothetical protein
VRSVLELASDRRESPARVSHCWASTSGSMAARVDRQRGGGVVARHARDEQIVDHRAEHEENRKGNAKDLLDLEGL